jgi:hypothetical protein
MTAVVVISGFLALSTLSALAIGAAMKVLLDDQEKVG